jgi:hypothetical protein
MYLIKKIALHLPILLISGAVAVLLARSDVFENLLSSASGSTFSIVIVSLIAGILYSSVFTVAPATVALFELAHSGAPIFLVAVVGGFGGMLADLSLFEIIKFGLIDDIVAHFQKRSQGRFAHLFKIKFFRLLITIVGALIIATPIPDEIGLAMMGLGRANLKLVVIVTFVLNTIGIAVLCLLAK